MINSLPYIQTLQSPLQGNNLSAVVKALSGQGNTASGPLGQQPPSMLSAFNTGLGNLGDNGPSSTFGGFNYSNNYDPNLSGQQLLQAAAAGTQSGLQFNPVTGTVS
jgi:hypothetical protein